MYPLSVAPGAPHSVVEKVKLLKVAAGRDGGKSSGIAWAKLGRIFETGDEGVEQDYRQSLECFERAAGCFNGAGALAAGRLLYFGAEREDGTGFKIRKNRKKAVEYYKLAAQDDTIPEAHARCGEVLVMGDSSLHPRALTHFIAAFERDPIANASCGKRLLSFLSPFHRKCSISHIS